MDILRYFLLKNNFRLCLIAQKIYVHYGKGKRYRYINMKMINTPTQNLNKGYDQTVKGYDLTVHRKEDTDNF